MPARTVGRLYYTNDEGDDRYCTGSVITSDNRNTVCTAGHCLHSGEDGDWFTDVHFVPDHDKTAEPHGQWEATRLVSARGWTDNGNWSYDLGAVELLPQPERGEIQGVTDAQGYQFGHGQDFDDVTVVRLPLSRPTQRPHRRRPLVLDLRVVGRRCTGAGAGAGLLGSPCSISFVLNVTHKRYADSANRTPS